MLLISVYHYTCSAWQVTSLAQEFFLTILLVVVCRIYVVHDEVKDKNFELELSWIGEGTERLACLLTIKLQFL